MAAIVMNLALGASFGASFLYGAYQTWEVQSKKVSNNTSGRITQSSLPEKYQTQDDRAKMRRHEQERILKFWVVLMSMLTVVPILDFFIGWIFGPLWILARLLVFWKVAYSRTLGSGYLFEQYEHYAKHIESNLREIVLLGRQFRTALIDFLANAVSKIFLMLTNLCVIYFSRELLLSAKAELKEINIALGDELDKVDRPGHKRARRKAEGKQEDAKSGEAAFSVAESGSGVPQGKEEEKEKVKISKPKSNSRTGLRRRKKDGSVK